MLTELVSGGFNVVLPECIRSCSVESEIRVGER